MSDERAFGATPEIEYQVLIYRVSFDVSDGIGGSYHMDFDSEYLAKVQYFRIQSEIANPRSRRLELHNVQKYGSVMVSYVRTFRNKSIVNLNLYTVPQA